MEGLTRRTTAVFANAFTVPGFSETLPSGEYELETELSAPPNHLDPDSWEASVVVHLHPSKGDPALKRSLTVSLADLNGALARDKLSGKELAEYFLDEMLSDPMVLLVMAADGVSEAQVRHLYSASRRRRSDVGVNCTTAKAERKVRRARERSAIQNAENEGMPTTSD